MKRRIIVLSYIAVTGLLYLASVALLTARVLPDVMSWCS